MASPNGPRAAGTFEELVRVVPPAYGRALAAIAALAVFAGTVLLLENAALAGLVLSLGGGGAPRLDLGLRAPWALACTLVAARVVYRVAIYLEATAASRLVDRGWCDLEQEVVSRLILNGEATLPRRPSDMIDELAFHVQRVLERRAGLRLILLSLPLAAGDVAFLCLMDWRVGALAAAAAVTAVSWTVLGAGPAARRDEATGTAQGRLRARIGELLAGVPELEIHHGERDARRELAAAQRERSDAARRKGRLADGLLLAEKVTGGAALAGLILFGATLHAGGAGAQVASIVPILVRALPNLFQNSADLARSAAAFRRGAESARRLVALLPAPVGASGGAPAREGPIELAGVTCRYGGAGGLVDATFTVPPGTWLAIVGHSGSGKSTLVDLLLGRRAPQAGTVRVGARDVADLPREARSELFSFLSQTPLLIDGSVRRNLLFGADGERPLSDAERRLLERSGLGRICKRWGLSRRARSEDDGSPLAAGLEARRRRLRGRLAAAGVALRELTPAAPAVDPALLELACGAPVDEEAMLERLSGSRARRVLRAMAATPEGRSLGDVARALLREQRALLAIPDYARFSLLSPRRIPEGLWKAQRRGLLEDAAEPLLLSALFARRSELLDGTPDAPLAAVAPALRALAGDAVSAIDRARPCPALPWRENLLLAGVEAENHRSRAAADDALIAALEEEGLGGALLELGLGQPVGPGGSRLSGGQRQLVGLCRAILRGTPILVLDEPTSALDPSLRDEVVELLRSLAPHRTIVTVTHDPRVARAADRFVMLDAGQVVATGPGAEYVPAGREVSVA